MGQGLPVRKVLQVHNRYRWSPGGEISVLEAEAALMRARGVEVAQFFVDNSDDAVSGLKNKLKTATDCVWSPSARKAVRAAIREHRPDLIHVHNFFVHLSPSVYWAAHDERIPVVQTLHNFRLLCAEASFLRDNRPCQDCVGKAFPAPALKHKCYKGSLAGTVPLVAMQVVNRLNGSFTKKVNAYIVLSEFAKEIFTRGGLPAHRLHVKGNFNEDPGMEPEPRKRQFVFVGRLSPEKGPDVLAKAWAKGAPEGWTCEALGEGKMREEVESITRGIDTIRWSGWKEKPEVEHDIRSSRFLVMTSTCYEGFPLSLGEALSMGTPAVVPDHGAMPWISEVPEIGLQFKACDPDDLHRVLHQAAAMADEEWQRRSDAARARYEAHFTAERNFEQLMDVYRAALADFEDQR